ncbi:MAG: WYL domain-containing protein [Paludibacteraceae bacterium]|nr:WYL domain-containing protein [Paludibacteraceae bacterium]
MPTNKNALSRIKFLDELLSDRHHFYNLDDLTEKCNEKLEAIDVKPVTRRMIEKDLNYIEYGTFCAEIERYSAAGKRCLRYADPSFSIFTKKLSDDEKNLLQETLSTLGQFDGLKNFEWLEDFKKRLDIEERRRIICFSNNPYLKNSNILGQIFNFISNRVVVYLTYQRFGDKTPLNIDLSPYLLRQYNDRWYLIGCATNDDKILTLPLDRIVEIQPSKNQCYKNPPDDFDEYFDDIIGVSNYSENPMLHIVFWVSDYSKDYVLTKPLHGSQKIISGNNEIALRKEYSMLIDGVFFSIECKCNYELIRLLSSFGKDLLVLSPIEIQEKVKQRVLDMAKSYQELST